MTMDVSNITSVDYETLERRLLNAKMYQPHPDGPRWFRREQSPKGGSLSRRYVRPQRLKEAPVTNGVCPQCKAPEGSPCVGRFGRYSTHAARLEG